MTLCDIYILPDNMCVVREKKDPFNLAKYAPSCCYVLQIKCKYTQVNILRKENPSINGEIEFALNETSFLICCDI